MDWFKLFRRGKPEGDSSGPPQKTYCLDLEDDRMEVRKSLNDFILSSSDNISISCSVLDPRFYSEYVFGTIAERAKKKRRMQIRVLISPGVAPKFKESRLEVRTRPRLKKNFFLFDSELYIGFITRSYDDFGVGYFSKAAVWYRSNFHGDLKGVKIQEGFDKEYNSAKRI